MEGYSTTEPKNSEILTCSICGKSVDSRKSQIRHISYCRRTRSRLRSRKRACFNCTKAKTHCDLTQPNCSRCNLKGFSCEYERIQPVKPPNPVAIPPVSMEQSVEVALNSVSTLDFASQSAIWDVNGPYDLSQQSVNESVELVSLNSPSIVEWNLEFQDVFPAHEDHAFAHPVYHHVRTSQQLQHFKAGSSTKFTSAHHSYAPLCNRITPKAPKSFTPRISETNQFSLNRKYVLSALRSYPYMILPGKSLPPFIHPQCAREIARGDGMGERSLLGPLATCAAIVQMFTAKTESNTIFIWKAIRMEQERISAESSRYDEYDAVAALQAVTIYCILRLSEENEEATNFDLPLIDTMMTLAFQVKDLFLMRSSSDGSTPIWKCWALAESLCRTTIVLFIIDMFGDYISSLRNYNCDKAVLTRMPLPCARDLWRATNSAEWKVEYAARSEESGVIRQLTYGDLMESRFRKDNALDSWLFQLDDFGTLVMAAASLPVNNV